MKLIVSIILIVVIIFLIGCSAFKGSKEEYLGYYGVNWTDDGDILAGRRKSKIHYDMMGDNGTFLYKNYSIVKINLETNEETDLFEIPWLSGILDLIATSDLLYFSLIKDSDYSKVFFYIYKDEMFVTENKIENISGTEFFRLSPSGEKISMYWNGTAIKIFNIQGKIIFEQNDSGYTVWKNDDEFFYYNNLNNKLSLYNLNNGSSSVVGSQFFPEYYDSINSVLLRIHGNILYKYSINSGLVISEKLLSFDGEIYKYHYFSPDGKKILLTKSRGFNFYQGVGQRASSSIYVYDLESDKLIKVRD